MIDLHCHILPGLDDGARSMDEAVEMARMAERDGIKKIVATPHLFRGNTGWNDLDLIDEKKGELNRALREKNIDIQILTGAEVHVSHNLTDEINKNRSHLVINQSSYMFIEFPAEHVFSGIKDLFFEIMSEGIKPIIVHPERNSVFARNPDMLYETVQMGGLSQANSGSFIGLYGPDVLKTAFQLLDLNLIHFIASDSHSPRSSSLWFSKAISRIAERVGMDDAQAFVNDNPEAVIKDQEIPCFSDPIDPRSKQRNFRLKIPSFLKK